MSVMSWARLQVRTPCGLRLGAWYPVIGLSARDAQVQVRGRLVVMSRSLLELRTMPPQQWTVVPPGVDPRRPLAGARDGHLVCPSCRHRETMPEFRVPTLRCARCNGAFAIAWHEQYPRGEAGARASSPDAGILDSRNRTTRRRPRTDRRASLERRGGERRSGLERRSGIERRHNAARWDGV